MFRIAAGWPASGTWRLSTRLLHATFAAASEDLGRVAFRLVSCAGNSDARALLESGRVESAVVQRDAPSARGLFEIPSALDHALSLGVLGDAVLHLLLRPGVRLLPGPNGPRFAGARIATIGLEAQAERARIEALGGVPQGPFSLARGLANFGRAELDGVAFWDVAPNPEVHSIVERGAGRLVSLQLPGEPRLRTPSTVYSPGPGFQSVYRPLDWMVLRSLPASWLQTLSLVLPPLFAGTRGDVRLVPPSSVSPSRAGAESTAESTTDGAPDGSGG